jgi:hypothetical protein
MSSIRIPLVKLTYDGRSYIADADSVLAEASELFPDMRAGETLTFKRVDLTTAELEALPEFDGF